MTQQIYSHTYNNGLVLVAEPMSSVESAAFTILVPAGSVYDPTQYGGLGVFLNEMVMRGAGERDNRRLVNDLDNLGVERGEGVSDAHSSFSGATLSKNLIPTLAIYADVLQRPRLPEEHLEESRQVLLQELRAVEDEPGQKVMIEMKRNHYPHPWGQPPQGNLEDLERVNLGDIQKNYERLFRPNGTIIGVAGKIDWEALKKEVGRLVGPWESKPEPVIEHNLLGKKIVHLSHESNQTHVGISYDNVPYRHDDYFQAWGGVGVLSGGMSSRLFTEVREKRGLCYTVYAMYHTLKEWGGVFCYAGTAADRAQETLDVMLNELQKLAEGIRPDELDRLKARIKSALIMQQESSSARSGSIARDWYHLSRVRTMEEVGKLVDDLTCESINSFLRRNPPRDFRVVTHGPKPLEVPHGVS